MKRIDFVCVFALPVKVGQIFLPLNDRKAVPTLASKDGNTIETIRLCLFQHIKKVANFFELFNAISNIVHTFYGFLVFIAL